MLGELGFVGIKLRIVVMLLGFNGGAESTREPLWRKTLLLP